MKERVFTGWLGIFLVIMASLVAGCAQMGTGMNTVQGEEGQAPVDDVQAGQPLPPPPPIYYEFSDIPIPGELKRDADRTMVVRTPGFQAGILVLKGRVTGESLVDFFTTKMPEHGWTLVGSMISTRSLLAFSKTPDSHCLIQIHDEPMGFMTEVQVWAAGPVDVGGNSTP